MKNWETLIKIIEKCGENSDFVAGCVYGYLAEYSEGTEEDRKFMNDLVCYLEGDSK